MVWLYKLINGKVEARLFEREEDAAPGWVDSPAKLKKVKS